MKLKKSYMIWINKHEVYSLALLKISYLLVGSNIVRIIILVQIIQKKKLKNVYIIWINKMEFSHGSCVKVKLSFCRI